MNLEDKIKGALFGLACGDAVGATVEFESRDYCLKNPVTNMVGGGVHELIKGQVTDDTSMALCLLESLIEDGFDLHSQLKKYIKWRDDGYYSSKGYCFDIGMQTNIALDNYITSKVPLASTSEFTSGNGSIMRLAPIPMVYYPSLEKTLDYAIKSSITTHGSIQCKDACKLLAYVIYKAFDGKSKEEILNCSDLELESKLIKEIANQSYKEYTIDKVQGSGWVVKSLEAALWCFSVTNNFRDAILQAANLGDDADTTAAITGQIAGAYYGYESIPENWRNLIDMKDTMLDMCHKVMSNK